MRKSLIIAALTIMVGASFNTASAADKKKKDKKPATPAIEMKLTTQQDSLSYAAGMTLTEGLVPFLQNQYGVSEKQLDDVERGFNDVMTNGADAHQKAYAAGQQVAFMVIERMLPRLKQQLEGSKDSLDTKVFAAGFINALKKDHKVMADTTAQKYFTTKTKQIQDARNAALRKAGEEFLAANKQKPGVVTTASGLQYKVLKKGDGKLPKADDEVIVKYEGKLIDGKVFDSSYKRGDGTAKFRPDQVIKGWTEALTMMPVGSKWELFIPYNLAYGERDMGEIKPFSALIFTVELVGIEDKKAPEEIAKPVDDKSAGTAKKDAKAGTTKVTKAAKLTKAKKK